MKNLIALIKSDGWLMLIALVMICLFIGIIVLVSNMFPNVVQVIAIILGVACIVGVLTTIAAWAFMYSVERACDKDNSK